MDKVTQALQDSLLRFWSAGAAAARNHKEASPKSFENEARRLARIAYAPDRITPEVVEAAARAFCIADGKDPDEVSGIFNPFGWPDWRLNYYDKAEAALLAAFAVLGGA